MGVSPNSEGAYEPMGFAERWRQKAEECRVIAERMHDPLARDAFLQIARAYEHRAEHLEAVASTRGGESAA